MAHPWKVMDPLTAISSDESSDDGDADSSCNKSEDAPDANDTGEVESKKNTVDYEALSRHGYTGGPSVLYVPPPRRNEETNLDWSWSSGKRKWDGEHKDDEDFEERERNRTIVNDAAASAATQAIEERNYVKQQRRDAIAEQRAISFAQKEKRKRNLGQASRGKNYVEEEKRLLRDRGVYSGFDT